MEARKIWFGVAVVAVLVAYGVVARRAEDFMTTFHQTVRAQTEALRGQTRHLGQALEIVGKGQRLEQQGNVAAALEQYKQAVALQPRFPYGRALLGSAYHRLWQDEKAMDQYQLALQDSPQHFMVHYFIGQLYREQRRYEEAIKKFQELIAMKENWYKGNKTLGYTQYQQLAYIDLGYCYAQMGDTQHAREAYERYLALNPSSDYRNVVERYIEQLGNPTP